MFRAPFFERSLKMSEILIENGTVVNDGRKYIGYVLISGERIAAVGEGMYNVPEGEVFAGRRIDASGKIVIPGVIDDQVHFREPGLTYKGDIASESVAAVAGGVTSFMEMPNTNPATISLGEWEWKMERAAAVSAANYSFYFGASNDNINEIKRLDPRYVCGVKMFMGSSTGNMLVDDEKTLSAVFAESPVLVAVHCEYEAIIRENVERFRMEYGDKVTPDMHPLIRNAEACYRSSAQAVELADKYGTDLHVLHLSTGRELSLFDKKPLADKKITNEVCVHHLWFSDKDYAEKGNFIKWNPAVKTIEDRDALREGLLGGKVDVVATDHAPHAFEEKQRPYWDCPSGGPLVQHSLVAMLELSSQGVFPVEQVVEKMCHAPAVRYKVGERGFLREGMYADIVIVNPSSPWTVGKKNILYKCGWSPFEGITFENKVVCTLINGRIAYENGAVNTHHKGQALVFSR